MYKCVDSESQHWDMKFIIYMCNKEDSEGWRALTNSEVLNALIQPWLAQTLSTEFRLYLFLQFGDSATTKGLVASCFSQLPSSSHYPSFFISLCGFAFYSYMLIETFVLEGMHVGNVFNSFFFLLNNTWIALIPRILHYFWCFTSLTICWILEAVLLSFLFSFFFFGMWDNTSLWTLEC